MTIQCFTGWLPFCKWYNYEIFENMTFYKIKYGIVCGKHARPTITHIGYQSHAHEMLNCTWFACRKGFFSKNTQCIFSKQYFTSDAQHDSEKSLAAGECIYQRILGDRCLEKSVQSIPNETCQKLMPCFCLIRVVFVPFWFAL